MNGRYSLKLLLLFSKMVAYLKKQRANSECEVVKSSAKSALIKHVSYEMCHFHKTSRLIKMSLKIKSRDKSSSYHFTVTYHSSTIL